MVALLRTGGRAALVMAAVVLLVISRIAIRCVPHARIAALLGEDLANAPAVPRPAPRQLRWARRVRAAIEVGARRAPGESVCYPQALTAHVLLAAVRVPHSTCFGVRRDPDTGELRAHAWVMAGPVAVSGGNGFSDHATVRTYLWDGARHAA